MNRNHFYFGYSGNKRNESPKIYESIKDNIEEFEIIIEPFCGSCAFSYFMSVKHPKKYKYIINDNNKLLIDLINLSKDELKFNEFIDKLKNLFDTTTTKEQYLKVYEKANNDLLSYVYIHKIYTIRPGLFPTTKQFKKETFNNMKVCQFLSFIRNETVEVLNIDAIELIKQYYNNKKAFIFLDPPYLSSCNTFYINPITNIYEYLYDNDINKCKSKVLLCLEANWIIKLLFKGKNIIEYDKLYMPSKKQTKHLVIKNKNIK